MTDQLRNLRCAVLGAGGFIGTNLCRHLNGKVDTLRAFGRRQSFPAALSGCDWMSGDFSDSAALAAAVSGCSVVYHLVNATTPASSNMDKIADVHTSIVNTLRLLDICREAQVKRIVFVSSGGTVYGVPKDIPTPESSPTDPISAYGISKLAIEKYLALYKHLYGLDYRVLRVANPYGPYQTAKKSQGVVAAFLSRILAGRAIELWGDGTVVRDYLYIDDVISALSLAACHEGSGKIFNIGGGRGHTLNEIISAIAEILNVEVSIEKLGARPVDVPASILDIALAEKDLGWRPSVDLADGLYKTVDWMRMVGSKR